MKEPIAPHNLVFVFIGASLLWVRWFGFNAGSALGANGLAAQAFLNTITAPAAAGIAWAVGEKITRGHASALGFVSGAVAGLVAITPAAGFAGTFGSIVLGAVTGFVCLWAVVTLKPMLKYDDSLDVFGIHGVGGIVGAIGTGIVVAPFLGGAGIVDYANGGATIYPGILEQVIAQAKGVGVTIVVSGVGSAIVWFIVKVVTGGRVKEEIEEEGLDLNEHGEVAYH
jgi:Amt family ammonium transporter